MSPLRNNLLLVIIMTCITIGSCEPSKEEQDKKCTENQLAKSEQGSIKVVFDASRSINKPTADHNLFDATLLEFHGEVILIDCRNTAARTSTISCSFNPSVLTAGKSTYSFWVAPPDYHDFFFTSNLEFCQVSYYMSAKFSDGKTYKSDIVYASTNQVKYWNGKWDQTSSSTFSSYTNWLLVAK
jgi:hypothetical protein